MTGGESRRVRDNSATLLRVLGPTRAGRPSSEQWLEIKRTVQNILVRHDLAGELPSTIRDLPIEAVLGQELESAHPGIFGAVQPLSHRQDLMQRIFVWGMNTSRRNVQRKVTGRSPKPSSQPSSQSPVPRLSTPPSPPVELPLGAGHSAIEEHEVAPLVKPSSSESSPLAAEFSNAESQSGDHSSTDPEPSGPGSTDKGSTSAGTKDGPVDGMPEPPQEGVLAAKNLSATKKQIARKAPVKPWATYPVRNGRKEVVITVIAPWAPRFQAKFMKSHLIEGSILSMAKLFQILTEEGFCHDPRDYVVRDEFQNQLSTDADLSLGFQKLASTGKLASVWKLIEKSEDRKLVPE